MYGFYTNTTASMSICKDKAEPCLNVKSKTLAINKTVSLKLKNAPSGKIFWVSGKPGVAKVSNKGVVTAKKKGKANIYAITNNKVYKCVVTVK